MFFTDGQSLRSSSCEPGRYESSGSEVLVWVFPIPTWCARITPFEEKTSLVGSISLDLRYHFNKFFLVVSSWYHRGCCFGFGCYRVNNEGVLPKLRSGHFGGGAMQQITHEMILL